MERVVVENGCQHVKLLPVVDDDHEGVIVEMEEPMDSETFLALLKASMLQWKLQVFIPIIFCFDFSNDS